VWGSFWFTPKVGQEAVAHRQKPCLSGLVYQRRTPVNPQHTAFWSVKQGLDKSEAGLSRSWEKATIHSMGKEN
jgi:hypothetical protein